MGTPPLCIDPAINQPFEMKQTAPWSRMLRLTAILALTVASTAQARLSVFEALDSASGHPTRFAQCPQFFADGKPPVIPARPKLRELCYEAFAVLHSGETKCCRRLKTDPLRGHVPLQN